MLRLHLMPVITCLFTFHYIYIYLELIFNLLFSFIYIPLCLYLYPRFFFVTTAVNSFTFHYVYIYIRGICAPDSSIYYIYIPLCLYLYSMQAGRRHGRHSIYIPLCLYLYLLKKFQGGHFENLHSTMFIFICI